MMDGMGVPESEESLRRGISVSTSQSEYAHGTTLLASHDLLSKGFMHQIMPRVGSVQGKVTDITKNQDVLLESLGKENEKLEESNVSKEIEGALVELKHYREKVLKIRTNMARLNEKTNKMKQRSIKLKQMRDQDDLKVQEKRHQELEQEKSLVAKPAQKPP